MVCCVPHWSCSSLAGVFNAASYILKPFRIVKDTANVWYFVLLILSRTHHLRVFRAIAPFFCCWLATSAHSKQTDTQYLIVSSHLFYSFDIRCHLSASLCRQIERTFFGRCVHVCQHLFRIRVAWVLEKGMKFMQIHVPCALYIHICTTQLAGE